MHADPCWSPVCLERLVSNAERRDRQVAARRWRTPLGLVVSLLVTASWYLWQTDRKARGAANAVCAQVRSLPIGAPLDPLIQAAGASKVLQHQELLILQFHGFRQWTWHECLVLIRPGRPFAVELRHERAHWLPFAPDRF